MPILKLEKIQEEWRKDSALKEDNLSDTILDSGRLHSKYLELLSKCKFQKKNEEMEMDILLKAKWLWYNGKMDQKEIQKNGWDYDPFCGIRKPIKSDLNYYYNADTDIQKKQKRIHYVTTTKEFLDDVIGHIRWRAQNIKNFIEWRKFTSGN